MRRCGYRQVLRRRVVGEVGQDQRTTSVHIVRATSVLQMHERETAAWPTISNIIARRRRHVKSLKVRRHTFKLTCPYSAPPTHSSLSLSLSASVSLSLPLIPSQLSGAAEGALRSSIAAGKLGLNSKEQAVPRATQEQGSSRAPSTSSAPMVMRGGGEDEEQRVKRSRQSVERLSTTTL